MAFFKFRKGGDGSASAPPQPESVEALRRRARQRLIGAAVLVLLGLIGFPLLFDTQPRPVAVDIPIEIPDRNKAKPLPPPPVARGEVRASEPVVQAPATSQPAAPSDSGESKVPAVAGPVDVSTPDATKAETAKVEPVNAEPAKTAPPAKPEVREPAKVESKTAPAKPEVAAKPAATSDASRAQALLEGKPEGKPLQSAAKQAVQGRFVVQVGAFADAGKARETRLKVEKVGLKTYTHVAETRDGRRIRVRVGPFATRAEADKAAGRIKELDLPAAILTL